MKFTRSRTRWFIGAAVVVVLVVVGLLLRPSALQVEVAVAARASLQTSVVADGQTRVRDRFIVAAPVSGRLHRITLREGALIEKGATVATLAPAPEDVRTTSELRARLDAAEAGRRAASARLEQLSSAAVQAAREATRRRSLADAGAISPESMEQAALAATDAERQVDVARADLETATANVAAARSMLIGSGGNASASATIEVRSPVGGRILKVDETSERVVTAGTPLLEIGNLGGLEVVVDVLSQDAAQIAVGAPMFLSDWGGDSVINAIVSRVEPNAFTKVSALGVEEQRVNVIGVIESAPVQLGAGFRVEARIATWTGNDVLVIPSSALFQETSGWAVYMMADGRAKKVSVTIGHRNDSMAEVLGGLSAGDHVILFPSDAVADGVRVTSRR